MIPSINDTEWFPSLRDAIENGNILAFGTERQAREAAMQYGWGRSIIRVERRFERAYIVGVLDFQPDIEGDVQFQALRIPLLRYETSDTGCQYQPVVKLRKPYK